ncbi:MAG: HipA domain-containing protein [Gemmatimonadales bacterium]|nr:HipA domain-containing protein [Gemmatimonadales bacterium]
MSVHALDVWDADTRIGLLGWDSVSDTFSFAYSSAWLGSDSAYPISPHFPLQSGATIASATIRRFIENLLPEGRTLDIAASTHRLSRNNLFGLIRELGRESTGALSFTIAGQAAPTQPSTMREVTHAELASRIAERARVPFSVWDGRVRLSIAGHQDKLAAYLDGDRIHLVDGALASTHILKPEPADPRVPCLVANEHYCMRLGAALGIPTAPVRILRVPDPVLVVERFDRIRRAGTVRRIHIIDACQALDLPASFKYEHNFGNGRDVHHIRDGIGFERLFSVLSLVGNPARATQALLRWSLLQYVIGNADAHGKNVSFFSEPHALTLAPFYDMVSTVRYPALDTELAMAFGDEFRLDAVSPFALADFASRIGVPRRALVREMRRMARTVAQQAPLLADSAEYLDEERDMVTAIAGFARNQAQKLLAMADPTLAVDPGLLDSGPADAPSTAR